MNRAINRVRLTIAIAIVAYIAVELWCDWQSNKAQAAAVEYRHQIDLRHEWIIRSIKALADNSGVTLDPPPWLPPHPLPQQ